MSNKLTDKQELFCKYYVSANQKYKFNATKSAEKAGYSKNSAQIIGSENLSKPLIQSRIAELAAKELKKLDVSTERILKEYERIAFFDIDKIYDEDGNVKNIKDIDEDSRRAIAEIKEDSYTSEKVEHTKRAYKMNNKLSALNDLARYQKLLTDKVINDNTNKNINIDTEKIKEKNTDQLIRFINSIVNVS